MAISLDISWEGRSAADFSRVFAIAAAVDNFEPPLKEIGSDVIAPSVAKNFDAGGRPAWLPLAESTVQRKSRAGVANPSKILVHSGAMEAAATDPSNYRVSASELKAAPFGVRYWGFHQAGDGVPKRIIMMLQASDRTQVMRIFSNYVRTFMNFNPRTGGRVFTGGGLP